MTNKIIETIKMVELDFLRKKPPSDFQRGQIEERKDMIKVEVNFSIKENQKEISLDFMGLYKNCRKEGGTNRHKKIRRGRPSLKLKTYVKYAVNTFSRKLGKETTMEAG